MIPYVVHDASGTILKSGYCGDEDTVALQADTGAGEVPLVLVGGDGGFIDDANIMITDGAFAPRGGYVGDLPSVDELVPLG